MTHLITDILKGFTAGLLIAAVFTIALANADMLPWINATGPQWLNALAIVEAVLAFILLAFIVHFESRYAEQADAAEELQALKEAAHVFASAPDLTARLQQELVALVSSGAKTTLKLRAGTSHVLYYRPKPAATMGHLAAVTWKDGKPHVGRPRALADAIHLADIHVPHPPKPIRYLDQRQTRALARVLDRQARGAVK